MSAEPYIIDRYVIDTLMADLVGHDHRPSAFFVYLAILAATADGQASFSYAEIADRTGLSKRTAQDAVAALAARGLIQIVRRGPTEAAELLALSPWRR